MARPLVAAGALFLDDAGRPLLVRPTYKDHWDIPGGYVEPGESPREACIREIQEELGITPVVHGHLVVDWAPADHEGDKLLFVFDGVLADTDLSRLRLSPDELAEARYVNLADLDRYVPARLSHRIRTAVDAKQRGQALYAEHGNEAR